MNLARLLVYSAPDEAEERYTRRITTYEQVEGPTSVDVAIALHGHRVLLSKRGRAPEAEALMLRTVELFRVNDALAAAALSLRELASIWLLSGRPEEAKRRCEESRELAGWLYRGSRGPFIRSRAPPPAPPPRQEAARS